MSSRPPHPSVSDGMIGFPSGGVSVPEATERRVEAIFQEALRETSSNRVPVGEEGYSGSDAKEPLVDLYVQIHGYHAYYDFSRKNFNSEKPEGTGVPKVGGAGWSPTYTHTTKNHGAEHFYDRVYGHCSVTIKKNFAVVRNHLYGKKWKRIRAVSVQDFFEQCDCLRDELLEDSVRALRAIVEIHGGDSSFQLDRPVACEFKVRGDDFINSIPPDMIIHGEPVFKKVYKVPNVEFYGFEYVKQYIKNRAVEDISPEIAEAIGMLAHDVRGLPDRLAARRDPWGHMFAHAEEFNALDTEQGTAYIREVFGL